MKPSLEEWQRQRKHVQEHLNWLDEQISLASTNKDNASLPPEGEEARVEPPSAPGTLPIEGLGTYSKVGCIALGILFCLLFLFLVFGLPYFIYR